MRYGLYEGFYAQPSERRPELQWEPQRRCGGRIKATAVGLLQVLSEHRCGALSFRIIAWCDWLLVVLVLSFGTYTYKCLDDCLLIGLKKQLSIRAEQIGGTFAKTGHLPVRQVPVLNDPLIFVHRSGGLVPALFGNPDMYSFATAPLKIRIRKYVIEVGAPKQPVKEILHETTTTLLIGLLVCVAFATGGSWLFIKRALVPFRKMALAVQALAVAQPDDRLKGVSVRDEIKNLCITVNEMIGRLEESFQIGTVIPAAVLPVPGTRLEKARGELAWFFKNARVSTRLAAGLLRLLKETERLIDIAQSVSTPSGAGAWQTNTERLRFYLAESAAIGTAHVCTLTEKLRSDLLSQSGGVFGQKLSGGPEKKDGTQNRRSYEKI